MGTSSRADGTTDREHAESETHHDQGLGVGIPSPEGQAPSFTCGRQSIRAAYERKKTKYQDLAQAIMIRNERLGEELVIRVVGVQDEDRGRERGLGCGE